MKSTKRTLELKEVESVKKQIEVNKSVLNASKEFGSSGFRVAIPEEVTIDRSKIENETKRLESILENDTPQMETNQAKRDKLLREAEQLKARFMPYLETWRDIKVRDKSSPEYQEAFEKAKERYKIEPFIAEWKEKMKQIDPNDPTLISLNRLRTRH